MFRSATESPAPLPPDWLPSRSAVLTRVPPAVRPRIDDQIINGPRRTYRDMYAHLEMSSYGVGFTSFYHYARKIRTASALTELNHPSLDTSRPAHELLPDIMAKNVLEAMVDPNMSSKRLNRLSLIYSRVQNAFNSRRMTEVNIEKAKAQTEAARRSHVEPGPRKREAYGPDAPFGRKADGTPYTEEEYEKGWRQAVREVYGLDLPANYGREREGKAPTREGEAPAEPLDPSPEQLSRLSKERQRASSLEPSTLASHAPERRVHPAPEVAQPSDSPINPANTPAPQSAIQNPKSAITKLRRDPPMTYYRSAKDPGRRDSDYGARKDHSGWI